MKNVLRLSLLLSLPFSSPVFAQDQMSSVIVNSDLSKQSSPLVQAPGNQVKKNENEIKEHTPSNLGEALGNEPNIEFQGGPRGQAETPQIRGLNADRILILDEGVRQNFQGPHAGRVFSDYSLFENIEIVKGPWSSLYGSGAMGGVINFRRSTAADLIRRTQKEQGVELALDGASGSSAFGQRVTAFAHTDYVEPLISYHRLKSEDIRLGNGDLLPYSAGETQDYYSSLGFNFGQNHAMTVKLDYFMDDSVAPLNQTTSTESAALLADTHISKQDIVGDYIISRDGYDIHAKPYFRRTEVKQDRVSDGRADMQRVDTAGVDAWVNRTFAITDTVTTVNTFGAEIFQDINRGTRNSGAMDSFPDGTTTQTGIYAQSAVKMGPQWTVTPGLRYDTYDTEDSSGQAANNNGQQLSAKIYTSYEFAPEKEVYLGWGQAYNAPRMQDLYVSGLHFPGGGPIPNNFFIANPDLKPETADTYELGTKDVWHLNEGQFINLSATYFWTEAKDFINRDVDVQGGTTQFSNLDKVRLNGFEVSSKWQSAQYGAGLAYGQVRSLNKNTDEPLSDTPADHWLGKFETYLSDNIILGTDLKYVQRQDRVPDGTDPSSDYFTEDFYGGYQQGLWRVNLRLNNAWNREYRVHGSNIDAEGVSLKAVVSYIL